MALRQGIEGIIIRVDDKPTPGTVQGYSGYARPGEIVIDPTTNPPTMYIGDQSGNLSLNWAGGGGGGGGNTANANYANFAGSAANANYANFAGSAASANSVAGANVTGEVSFAAVANSVALANVVGAGNIANINLDGNVQTSLRGDGTWSNICDITGEIGGNFNINLINGEGATSTFTFTTEFRPRLILPGVLETELVRPPIGGNDFFVDAYGNIVLTPGTGKTILGDATKVQIDGGTAGQVLSTDGSGGLSWTTVAGGNVTSIVNGNSNVIVTANGNVSTSAGGNANVFVVAPNGTFTTGNSNISQDLNVGGNAIITGNLIVNGNTNYINVNQLQVESPLIEMGGGPNGAPLITNDGKDRGSWLHVFDTGANAQVDKFMGWDNSNAEFAFGSNVTVANSVATFNQLGNVRASTFIGNLSGIATSANGVFINTTNFSGNFNLMLTGAISNGYHTPWVESTANTFVYNPSDNRLFVTNANISGVSNLGNVGNVKITGGSNGQYLKTDGTGNLVWANVSAGANVATQASMQWVAASNGTGQTFSNAGLANIGSTALSSVFVNGVLTPANTYSISGTTLTMTRSLTANDVVTVGAFGYTSTSIGAGGSNTQVQYNNSGNLGGITGVTANATAMTFAGVGNISIAGGSNGQVLRTDGSGNLSWGPGAPTVVTTPITIGATTTAPTKPTTRAIDYITLVDDGSGWVSVNMSYAAASPGTGSNNGSGTYLFSLPGGYQFDTTVHPLNTQTDNMSGTFELRCVIPGSTGQATTTFDNSRQVVVAHSATQFKLMDAGPITGSITAPYNYVRSDYYQLPVAIILQVAFRFKKA